MIVRKVTGLEIHVDERGLAPNQGVHQPIEILHHGFPATRRSDGEGPWSLIIFVDREVLRENHKRRPAPRLYIAGNKNLDRIGYCCGLVCCLQSRDAPDGTPRT